MKQPWILAAITLASLCTGAGGAFAQATVVSPAASGAISSPYSGTNAVNPAPSGVRNGTGDVTDNRGSTSFGDLRTPVRDAAVLGSVVSALASDPALRGADLQVEVDGGVVGVTGHARDSAQAQRAGQVAAQAANGARVETDIDVE
ncbi:MAG TPA: BON domain-containing protein [Usitatibacter sp.]|jgi:osmotically-inducible protein OsmY|nr:BON domain-containing protein [Usitatibacter sp.]